MLKDTEKKLHDRGKKVRILTGCYIQNRTSITIVLFILFVLSYSEPNQLRISQVNFLIVEVVEVREFVEQTSFL